MTEVFSGWIAAPITEIASVHDSRRVPLNATQRAEIPGDFPYYGANGLVDYVGDFLFDGEFVLLAEDGGYFDDPKRGVAYEVSGRFWVNNHAHILKPEDGISTGFLCYWLNAKNWMPHVGGTTRLKLTQAGMKAAEFPIPPLPEQRRIVAKLDLLSARSAAARDHLARTTNLAARAKQAILGAVFDEAATASWNAATIKDVVSDGLVGLVRSKAQQSDQGTPYIRMNHYDTTGTWNSENLTYVEASDAEMDRYELRAGDLLFNTRNSAELVGKVALWPAARPGHVYNNNLLRLRFSTEVLAEFVCLYMLSPTFRRYLGTVTSATTSVAAIYQKSLMKGPFLYPDRDLQEVIVRRIEAAFARIDRLTEEATRAAHLLDRLDERLRAKAFRGELVPQDPNDEPAEALLARIRETRATAPKPKRGRKKKAAHAG